MTTDWILDAKERKWTDEERTLRPGERRYGVYKVIRMLPEPLLEPFVETPDASEAHRHFTTAPLEPGVRLVLGVYSEVKGNKGFFFVNERKGNEFYCA